MSCHGPDKVKAALRLDSRDGVLKGGDSGPAVVPGRPEESLLLQAVMHSKKDLEMPPKEKLTTNDIAVLRRWIIDGVPWPTNEAANVEAFPVQSGEIIGDAWSDPRNPIVKIFGGQRLDLWSVKPIKPVRPPAIAPPLLSVRGKVAVTFKTRMGDVASVRNEVDAFIVAELQKHGLRASPEANRRVLARRLYFDLLGLPPSAKDVERFVADSRPNAYERLVDELLASAAYGEHMARLWMDVIRYSDSNGFDWDEFRPQAWRFRDYLIRSFNADKPFDRFVTEQLAGDELVNGAPKTEAERDCLLATGYLRVGPQDNSAALFNEQARARSEHLTDLTETTSSAFLGLTMSCCRCHDHKYDPLSQADHYRMRAFFEPVRYGDDISLDLAAEQESIAATNQSVDAEIKPLRERRNALLAPAKAKLREGKLAKLTDEERALLAATNRSSQVSQMISEVEKKLQIKDKEALAIISADEKTEVEQLSKKIDGLTKTKRSLTFGLLATDTRADKVPLTKILYQGDYKAERASVPPGFISILDPNPATISRGASTNTTGRRLSLARWVVSTNNPLMARVIVNRVWQSHFAKGLVATPNDFGLAGARPTHPELLDWLSTEFMRNGWSLKKLHRLMVTSATYRQSSIPINSAAEKIDHENALLWRQNLRRLSAEQLRDSLLAVSGLLKADHRGGPPVWPDLPAEVLQANPAFLDDNAEKTKGWYPSPKTNQNVRSVYLVQKRTVRVPFLETFDMPENSVSCPRRIESIVAPQALSLLNSSLSIEAANALAERIKKRAGDSGDRQIEELFALALQRSPTAEEKRTALAVLSSRSLPEVCRALLNVNEFVYVD